MGNILYEYYAKNNSPLEGKRCNVEGRYLPRHKGSGYCKNHERNKERYGHPLGRTILPRDYRQEQAEIRVFNASLPSSLKTEIVIRPKIMLSYYSSL
jgi:hypothetical protein